MKKTLALLLAVLMVLALGVNVLAASTTTYTLTITNETNGYVYSAYQIFKGDYDDTGKTLTNIEWGDNIGDTNGAALITALQNDTDFGSGTSNAFVGCTTAAEVAAVLATKTGSGAANTKFMQDFADAVSTKLDTTSTPKTSGTWDSTNKCYTITDLAPGYYFVKNTTVPSNTTNTSYTDFILQLVQSITVSHKGEVPTVEKKVKDINDSTDTTLSDWQDSADHDIGDVVYYKITGTLPSNYDDYKQYYYKFTDTISKGLTYIANTSSTPTAQQTTVTVYDKDDQPRADVTGEFTINSSTNSGTGVTTLTISCDDLKTMQYNNAAFTLNADDYIVVTYACTLNDDAVIGYQGNPNTVNLTYSNNPNQESGGTPDTGKTPDDKNIVFTYEVDVDKVTKNTQGNEVALTGAKFTLYKLMPVVDQNTDKSPTGITGFPADTTGHFWKPIGSEVAGTGTDSNSYAWEGVDDGKYCLVESTTPTGYNTMTPLVFTISAAHDTPSADPKLTSLTVDQNTWTVKKTTGTPSQYTGVIYGKIENTKGATLPSTGGIGTTVFTVGGIVMMLAAAVLLVTKKRMGAEK